MKELIKNIKVNEEHVESAIGWLNLNEHNGLDAYQITSVLRYLLKNSIEKESTISNDTILPTQSVKDFL